MERGGSRHKAEANRLPNEADSSRPAQHEVAEEVRTRIVYFFLPTPEPMRFPEGFTCATLRPVDLDTLREADLAEQHETPEPEVMCSVKVWQIDRPFPGYFSAQYDAMTEAARRGLPPEVSPPPRDGPVDEVVESSGFVQTVCEVAVYVDQWPEADEDEEGADPLTDAFDLALEAIRSLQNGYYLTTQEPVTLISQEALPPMVPCFVRRVVDGRPEADDWSEGASAFFINDSYVTLVPGPPLDDEALDRFQAVLDTSEPGRAFLGFADMLRDAPERRCAEGSTAQRSSAPRARLRCCWTTFCCTCCGKRGWTPWKPPTPTVDTSGCPSACARTSMDDCPAIGP